MLTDDSPSNDDTKTLKTPQVPKAVLRGDPCFTPRGGSPKSSERLVRLARARIPNDVRVREADYFDGSRAPESQGQKGSELATTENPKGEQTNLIAKRARASNLNHFVEILIKGIKAQARQMSTPATSNQMNENEEPAPGSHRLSTTPAY